MSVLQLVLDSISFTYPDSSRPVFTDLTVHFHAGWTGVIGANGSGKTTLLRIAAGELLPHTGKVTGAGEVLLCSQRTDKPPQKFDDFLAAVDADACKLRGRLGIVPDWRVRWDTLSHGERKRGQIAAAMWRKPHILLLDEPTNHIDEATRDLLAEELSRFSGVGILVTHDRTLLDYVCSQCLFLDGVAVMRPGGYTQGVEECLKERRKAHHERDRVKAEVQHLKREMNARRREASNADRKRSKRGISRNDSDSRHKIDMARVSGKDSVAGNRLRQLTGRSRQAEQRLREMKVVKDAELGIWLPGLRSRRDVLFSLPERSLALGPGRTLHTPAISMLPDDRIGVTGANGSGKSTLIGHILDNLQLPAERVINISQEISADASRTLLHEIRRLPASQLGSIMEIVSRLNSHPGRLLESDTPSPGEVRKIMLALGILRKPHLIIMDEPTNHLDLPSIESLEKALIDCPCGLLLASHDRRFLTVSTRKEWRITTSASGSQLEIW